MLRVTTSKETIKKINQLYDSGLSVEDVADELKIPRSRVYRHVTTIRKPIESDVSLRKLHKLSVATIKMHKKNEKRHRNRVTPTPVVNLMLARVQMIQEMNIHKTLIKLSE